MAKKKLTKLDIESPSGRVVGHKLKDGVTVEEAIHRLAWYENMGLSDIVKLANEFTTPKKPVFSSVDEPLWCPTCDCPIENYEDAYCCSYCGQVLKKPDGI